MTVKANSVTNYDIILTSHESAKAQIRKLKTKKSFWLLSGLVLSGAGAYYKMSADKHFSEYNAATDNAEELHEMIAMEDQIYPSAFGLGGVCLMRAFMLHRQEVKLKKKWQ